MDQLFLSDALVAGQACHRYQLLSGFLPIQSRCNSLHRGKALAQIGERGLSAGILAGQAIRPAAERPEWIGVAVWEASLWQLAGYPEYLALQ